MSDVQKENKPIPEWQQERIEMVRLMGKHILDPIMVFASLVTFEKEKVFDAKEVCAILRLMILGGYMELKTYCVTSAGGHMQYFGDDSLASIGEEFYQIVKKFRKQRVPEE